MDNNSVTNKIVAYNSEITIETIMNVDASHLSADELHSYMESASSYLSNLIVGDADEFREEFKQQVVDKLVGRLTSEERQSFGKIVDDHRTYLRHEGLDANQDEQFRDFEDLRDKLFLAYLQMGIKDAKNKSYDEALLHLDEAIEVDSTKPEAYNMKSMVFQKKKMPISSLMWAIKAHEVKEDDTTIKLLKKLAKRTSSFDRIIKRARNYEKKGFIRYAFQQYQLAELIHCANLILGSFSTPTKKMVELVDKKDTQNRRTRKKLENIVSPTGEDIFVYQSSAELLELERELIQLTREIQELD